MNLAPQLVKAAVNRWLGAYQALQRAPNRIRGPYRPGAPPWPWDVYEQARNEALFALRQAPGREFKGAGGRWWADGPEIVFVPTARAKDQEPETSSSSYQGSGGSARTSEREGFVRRPSGSEPMGTGRTPSA